jgi:hypothetical protein
MIREDEDLTSYFNGLSGDLGASNPHKEAAQELAGHQPPVGERHTCFECNGTGFYQGVRLHQEKQHCFACKGKGWFRTSWADRQKAKLAAAGRKQAKHEEKQAAFCEQHPGLVESLQGIASWHQFAATLLEAYNKWGSLTDRQVEAARASLAKVAAKRAERDKEKASKSGEVGVDRIEELFKTAKGNGLKRPRFITDRLQISLAPATGRNAGALYVKCDGQYAGKIVGGQLQALREAPADILQLVRAIAEDPLEAARKYGRDTGTCSCCGRELTDKKSIEAGIGPVCESKWF